MQTTTVPVGGAKLRVIHQGSGHAVIFLHAGVCDRRMWLDQLDALSNGRLVVAYDRRGFGETTSPDEPFSHVGDLLGVMDALAIGEASLVGCSQGGRIAVDVAIAHPDRVTELVLIAPALSGYESDFVESQDVVDLETSIEAAERVGDLEAVNRLEALEWLDGPAGPEGRVGGEARELFLDMNAIALAHSALDREVAAASAMPSLAAIQQRTLVAWGALDLPWEIDLCRRLAAQLPNAETHVFPAAAHLPSMEMPGAVNELLRAFLH